MEINTSFTLLSYLHSTFDIIIYCDPSAIYLRHGIKQAQAPIDMDMGIADDDGACSAGFYLDTE